jgi:flagellar P-ring protein precursor FlgI
MLLLVGALAMPAATRAETRIGDIARIKGQEENILHGMGLVVGLRGTGDGENRTTQRALAHYMELLGHRVGSNPQGQPMLEELKSVKNVALVFVTARVPPAGAQQGDELDCILSAVSAKSLEGGYLMLTELYGPLPGDKTVYALAKGLLSVDDESKPQTARVAQGAQLERKIENEFVKDGKLLMVMSKDHSGFQSTAYLESVINQQPDFSGASSGNGVARAIDGVQIEVTIPPTYADNPALFASLVLDTRITHQQPDTRVIVNERTQALIIGVDVEVSPVAVMHKNRLIQVGDNLINEAVEFDPSAEPSKTRLTALVDALNNLKVPTEDVINIIKMLKHKRALFGELIIE